MMKKIVLFDVDNTLVKTGKLHGDSFKHAIKKVQGVEPEDKYFDSRGMLDKGIIMKIYEVNQFKGDIPFSDIYSAMVEYYEKGIADEEVVLLPGVKALLEKLKAKDVIIGLNTGNVEAIAYAKLKKVGIADYFKIGGFGTESVDRCDLAKYTVDKAEEQFGKFDEVFVIGDTVKDEAAGKGNGFKSIGVATGNTSYDDLLEADHDYVFHDLTEDVAEVILGD